MEFLKIYCTTPPGIKDSRVIWILSVLILKRVILVSEKSTAALLVLSRKKFEMSDTRQGVMSYDLNLCFFATTILRERHSKLLC